MVPGGTTHAQSEAATIAGDDAAPGMSPILALLLAGFGIGTAAGVVFVLAMCVRRRMAGSSAAGGSHNRLAQEESGLVDADESGPVRISVEEDDDNMMEEMAELAEDMGAKKAKGIFCRESALKAKDGGRYSHLGSDDL